MPRFGCRRNSCGLRCVAGWPPSLFLKLVFVYSKTTAAAPRFVVFKAWAPEAMNSWIFLPAAPRVDNSKISRGKHFDIPTLSKIRKEWGSRFWERARKIKTQDGPAPW
ncbi:MAG: hypothetical protein DMG88_03200 [Acidobacteria bacterium]|nr:MAG: hypothetical protein DMG88_03200 [Acidobacteriota bacterium]